MKSIKIFYILFLLTCCISCASLGSYEQIEHKILQREDGGYSILINGQTQHIQPISSEGFFPNVPIHYRIDLIGKGKDWSYRNQPGFYYSYPDMVKFERNVSWDYGYVWVDQKREYIYLNFYWVDSPNLLKESSINGKYKIK